MAVDFLREWANGHPQFDINRLHFGVLLKHPKAVKPTKSKGNVGIDLYCVGDSKFKERTFPKLDNPEDYESFNCYLLGPGERYLFSTGIHLEIPAGYAIILKDRSGNAANKGLHVLGGVIDSSYTGELKVILYNTSDIEYAINENDKVCQMVVVPDYECVFDEIVENQLKNTDRGDKGFGSSGR